MNIEADYAESFIEFIPPGQKRGTDNQSRHLDFAGNYNNY